MAVRGRASVQIEPLAQTARLRGLFPASPKATPMRWLFTRSLRPFVLLAAGASLLLNVAMLVPSFFTLQVFERVFASRSIETLVMLSVLTLLALGFAYCMDTAR